MARTLRPRPLALESVPLLARFRIGYTVLRRADLMQLRRGDGIMFDHTVLRQHKVIAVVAERFTQTCTVASAGLMLAGPLNMPAPPDLRGYCMNDQMDPSSNDPAFSLSSMPMKLVFELGRVEINLGELRHLGEGHVFELNKARAQSVDLVVSGHIVGTGEIVRVGEGLGIRVMTIVEP
jgi:type III secretion protein Q